MLRICSTAKIGAMKMYIIICHMIKRYQYKRRTQKRRMPEMSDSTNVGRTNLGPVQTSDHYKCRTSTNVGLVQTSDQYKRRTGTFIRKNVGLGRF